MLRMLSIAQLMQTDPHVRLRLVRGQGHNTGRLLTSEGNLADGTFHTGRIFETFIEPDANVLL